VRRAVAIAGLMLSPFGAAAEEGSPPAIVVPQAPSLSESVPMPRLQEPGMNGYRLIAIAAGAVVGVIAINYMTGGLITPILTYGSGAAIPAAPAPLAGASAGAVVAFIAIEAAMTVGFTAADLVVASAGPIVIASVGGPVHVALSDGYTTPEALLAAIGTSISAIGPAAAEIGTHIDEMATQFRSATGDWLTGG
jgi:hypothetical protein